MFVAAAESVAELVAESQRTIAAVRTAVHTAAAVVAHTVAAVDTGAVGIVAVVADTVADTEAAEAAGKKPQDRTFALKAGHIPADILQFHIHAVAEIQAVEKQAVADKVAAVDKQVVAVDKQAAVAGKFAVGKVLVAVGMKEHIQLVQLVQLVLATAVVGTIV